MQATVGMYGDLQGIAGKTLQEIERLELKALDASKAIELYHMSSKKTAFVLMPFADEFSEVYNDFISVCLQDAGYDVNRGDDIRSQRNIIEDVIKGIVNCDLIVADLTGANPNVYYELGIAHALDKNVILLTQEIDELPFDLRAYRVVGYGTHFKKMHQAKNELSELAVEAFCGNLPFGNPVRDFGNANPSLEVTVNPVSHSESQVTGEDLGLFDYRVMLEDGLEQLGRIVTEVGEKLECEVTPELTKSAEKLKSDKFNAKQQRDIIRELAGHLQEYGAFVKPKNEKYRLMLKNIESSLENIFSGNFELGGNEGEQKLQEFLDILLSVESSAVEGRKGFVGLIDTMEALPKIERSFNLAKTSMATELKTFVDRIDQTVSIIARAERLGRSMIKREHNEQLASDN